ncbi:uncharacterized protein LOC141649768 [Silene latifolia]|uniref:uncharacterized protein LOC141649768 n=1 Tax=Silene latifolia TaxID=37657 RepID=UPI003D77A7FE
MDSSPSSVNVGTPSIVNVPTPSSVNVPTPFSLYVDASDRPEGRDAATKKRNGKAPEIVPNYMLSADDREIMEGNRLTTKEQIDFLQKRLSDYQWEAEADERSEAIQNLIAQRMNEYVNRRILQPNPPPRRRRRNIKSDREEGHKQLYNDYFMDPVYPEELFRRRFRMHKHLFMRIVNALSANDRFFQQRVGGNGRPSFSPLQRCTTALRVLAYGTSTDSVDEYLRMSDTSIWDSLKLFVEGVISCFGNEYQRRPNPQDLGRLLHMGQAREFPGMLGSIDCMHWEWKNCPTAWAGQYAERSSKPLVILEAVASYDLWIWHAFFGTPGSLNDINVLERSPLFYDVLEESAPPVNFSVNGTDYNMGYYLTDGIYPG